MIPFAEGSLEERRWKTFENLACLARTESSNDLARELIELYCEELRASRVRGVHLVCGAAADGFYRRLGFEELARLEFRPGTWVHALGRRLEESR